LFIFQFFFFRGVICRGYAGLSQVWLGEYHMMLGTHLFGLLNVSQAGSRGGNSGGWWQQLPTCFLSVMWHGEAFYGLGVQGVKVLILLCASFLPSVAPACQQGF
jgi:hypothetical protein